MKNEDEKRAYSAEEVSKILGVSTATVYRIFAEPDFPAIYLRRRAIVMRSDFEAWLSKQAGAKRANTAAKPITTGKRLADLRNAAGLTQAEVGEMLGVSRSMIAKFETDTDAVPVKSLIKYHQLFDVSYDYLLCEDIREKAE